MPVKGTRTDHVSLIVIDQTPRLHSITILAGGDLPSADVVTFNKKIGLPDALVLALNCNTEYVCIAAGDVSVDDKWIGKCIDRIREADGIYGCSGTVIGETAEATQAVDLLHGVYFFRKVHLAELLQEIHNNERDEESEVSISYAAQKYLRLSLYVLPQDGDSNQPLNIAPEIIPKFETRGWERIATRMQALRDYALAPEYFFRKMLARDPFCLMRYGDGEYFIINKQTYKSTREDNWIYSPEEVLSAHLNETLQCSAANVFYGIHAPCDVPLYHESFKSAIHRKENITYATLFCNKNFDKFKNFLQANEFNAVVIASQIPATKMLGSVSIIGSYTIEEQLVERWDREWFFHLDQVKQLAKRHMREVFLIAAGPLAKIFINAMYRANPKNVYCDVGSALDFFTKGRASRAYFDPKTEDARHACQF